MTVLTFSSPHPARQAPAERSSLIPQSSAGDNLSALRALADAGLMPVSEYISAAASLAAAAGPVAAVGGCGRPFLHVVE